MHISRSTFAAVALSSVAFAAPSQDRRGFLDDVKQKLDGVSLAGVANAVKQSISDPGLTLARIEVVKGLKDTKTALDTVAAQARNTTNNDVVTFAEQGATGLSQAQDGVNGIGKALLANQAATPDQQKQVAVGIKAAQDAIACMTAAITTPDDALSADIAKAQTAVGGLRTGGEGVINAQGKGFAALGLPDNFDQIPPNCDLTGASASDTAAAADSAVVTATASAGDASVTDTGAAEDTASADGAAGSDLATDVVSATATADEAATTDAADEADIPADDEEADAVDDSEDDVDDESAVDDTAADADEEDDLD